MTEVRTGLPAVKPYSSDIQRKIDLFRRAFGGAEHVYAIRTESGWQPIHAPLRDKDIVDHLSGRIEIGAYPILRNRDHDGWPMCRWIGADFDGKKPGAIWKPDVLRATEFFLDAPILMNLSRSGQGAHIRALFSEPVPTWLARRWMFTWLEESGVTRADGDEEVPTSFDRCIPSQDDLPADRIGSLLGCPLNKYRASVTEMGTLILSVEAAARKSLEVVPQELHWDYIEGRIERAWTRAQLERAVADSSADLGLVAPERRSRTVHLSIAADASMLHFTASFCEFVKWCVANPSLVNYELWVALAANLQPFGEEGRALFHTVSALDAQRYKSDQTEWKWNGTKGMGPVRCDTIAKTGFVCHHLNSPRCGGAATPAHLHRWSRYDPI